MPRSCPIWWAATSMPPSSRSPRRRPTSSWVGAKRPERGRGFLTCSARAGFAVLEEPSRVALAGYGVAGVLLLAAAGALTYQLGRRLLQSAGVLGIDRQPTREEFRILFENAPNGVVVVDDKGVMVLLNGRMAAQFGYPRDELLGRPIDTLIPERFRAGHAALREAFMHAPQARSMGGGRELFGQRKDGSEFPIEIGLNPINTAAGRFMMATVLDVTARRRAQQRLWGALAERDDLRRRFTCAQEEERLRLARELHDQTGQSITAAMLELKNFERLVPTEGRDRLRLLRRQMEEVGKTLHRVAWELRPPSIDELGLSSALANYISEWSGLYGIAADFHCSDGVIDQRPDEVRITVYRVVQEALTNIVKHAPEATTVSVVLEYTSKTLRLTIEDNGSGFDTAVETEAAGEARARLGLAGMRERLLIVGGELEIESSRGVGTTLFARIPLQRERTAA
ncbi:MAG: hypothetical protein C5B56_16025 [Proteobacteria bacterium]|nr:MAG: hypothetical protein C5B56_16025 [Pseudomonadota bacterium]